MYRFRGGIASFGSRAMTTGTIALGLVLVMVALRVIGALADPHHFDSTFNGSGTVKIDFGGNEQATDLVPQPDGKILVAGFTSSNNDAAVFRLNPDGSFDTAFSGDGKRALDSGGNERANALALKTHGKILVAGFTSAGTHGNDAIVYRLNSNGSLDKAFSGDGKRLIDSRGNERANALALQPDGKILIAGVTARDIGKHATVYRLNPNGSFDTTFSDDGKRLLDLGGNEAASALTLQPDGKILVAGYTTDSGGDKDPVVYRLNANGSMDMSFNDDGVAVSAIFAGSDAATALALQPDGKILFAGYVYGGTSRAGFIARLNVDGTLNRARGIGTAGDEALHALTLQPNGKILVAGYSSAGRMGNNSGAIGKDATVYRLTPDDHSNDTTFASNGTLFIDSGGHEVARALGLQSDGKILVAGYTSAGITGADATVYRLLGDSTFSQIPGSSFSGIPGP